MSLLCATAVLYLQYLHIMSRDLLTSFHLKSLHLALRAIQAYSPARCPLRSSFATLTLALASCTFLATLEPALVSLFQRAPDVGRFRKGGVFADGWRLPRLYCHRPVLLTGLVAEGQQQKEDRVPAHSLSEHCD